MQSKAARLKAVESLKAARDGRAAADQIRELDFRLGKGHGARKERARLRAQIVAIPVTPSARPVPEGWGDV